MAEHFPKFLEDHNSTLELGQRAANLVEVYQDIIPDLLKKGATLDTAVKSIHGAVGKGFRADGLENVAERLAAKGIDATQVSVEPGHYRDRRTTDILEYETTLKGVGYNDIDGQFIMHILCPGEEIVPDLMAGISAGFERMLNEVRSSDDAVVLAIWASQLSFLVHPFYDGNGRTCRTEFTYALQRTGQPSLCIENPRESKSVRALPFLTSIAMNTILKLYSKDMDALPSYIPLSRNPVTANDIIGLPSYTSIEEQNAQKKSSLEQLLSRHLDIVTMHDVREIFTVDDIESYKMNAQLLPS
jgi:hypothetical protein